VRNEKLMQKIKVWSCH